MQKSPGQEESLQTRCKSAGIEASYSWTIDGFSHFSCLKTILATYLCTTAIFPLVRPPGPQTDPTDKHVSKMAISKMVLWFPVFSSFTNRWPMTRSIWLGLGFDSDSDLTRSTDELLLKRFHLNGQSLRVHPQCFQGYWQLFYTGSEIDHLISLAKKIYKYHTQYWEKLKSGDKAQKG